MIVALCLFALWSLAGIAVVLAAVIWQPDQPRSVALPIFGAMWTLAYFTL
jgi:hypothetical protein